MHKNRTRLTIKKTQINQHVSKVGTSAETECTVYKLIKKKQKHTHNKAKLVEYDT